MNHRAADYTGLSCFRELKIIFFSGMLAMDVTGAHARTPPTHIRVNLHVPAVTVQGPEDVLSSYSQVMRCELFMGK